MGIECQSVEQMKLIRIDLENSKILLKDGVFD